MRGDAGLRHDAPRGECRLPERLAGGAAERADLPVRHPHGCKPGRADDLREIGRYRTDN